MRRIAIPIVVLIAAIAIVLGMFIVSALGMHDMPMAMAQSNPCGLSQVAFCDSFDQPFPQTSRSGPLDPAKWSLSRLSSWVNPNDGTMSMFVPSIAMHCKDRVSGVVPPNDYFECGPDMNPPESNHFMEAFDDHGGYVYNSARIRQPFDFTNRTGIVDFEVDAKTNGGHGWWVEVWLTDEPMPGPHNNVARVTPRNGVGFALSADCGRAITSGGTEVGSPVVSTLVSTTSHNYSVQDAAAGGGVRGVNFLENNFGPCLPTMPDMRNKFRLFVNQQSIEIWGTNPGETTYNKLNVIQAPLNFTVGYLNFQHSQYNAGKSGAASFQTYHWDNIGFDGPVLPTPREYAIDDALTAGPVPGSINTAYHVTPSGLALGPRTFTGVDLTGAQSATLSWNSMIASGRTVDYRINSGTWKTWAINDPADPGGGSQWRGANVPVPLSDLRAGNNTVDFAVGGGGVMAVANIDLHLSSTAQGPQPTPTATSMPTSSANFLGTNGTTQGSWKGVYGQQGYWLEADGKSLPAYATANFGTASLWTWSGSTSDARALQKAASQTDRLAATWYGPSSFTLDLNLTDGQEHKVSIYTVDWDSTSRTQRVEVLDAGTGAVLDSRDTTAPNRGTYLSWKLKGHVLLRSTRISGDNAVISALFFDP